MSATEDRVAQAVREIYEFGAARPPQFSAADIRERGYWNEYQKSYEEMIRHTSSKRAPWFVVPADNKWFTRLVVSSVIVDALQEMKLAYPEVRAEKRKALAAARRELEGKAKPNKS